MNFLMLLLISVSGNLSRNVQPSDTANRRGAAKVNKFLIDIVKFLLNVCRLCFVISRTNVWVLPAGHAFVCHAHAFTNKTQAFTYKHIRKHTHTAAHTHTCHIMHNKCAPVNNPCFVPTICVQHGLVLAPSFSPSWRARPKLARQLRRPHALLHILDVDTALSRHTSFGMRCLAGVCQAKPFDGANRRGVQFD